MTISRYCGKIRQLSIAAIVGLAGSGIASVALAADFGVNASVQNTLTINVDQDMDTGTLFASSATSGGVKYMTMQLPSDGSGTATWDTAQEPAANTGLSITFISLAPPTPARGTITGVGTADLKITLPGEHVDWSSYDSTAAGDIPTTHPDAVAIENTVGNPDIPDFYLVNFFIGDETTTGTNDPTLSNSCTDTTDGDYPVCTITPGFTGTTQDISFSIGMDITTDDRASVTGQAYQATTYTGSFEVTASY